MHAFRNPNVWGTLLTAALLQINDLDQEISDQLREDTPLFGSTEDAHDASGDFRDLTRAAYVSTALLAPGPEGTGKWFVSKIKLLGSERVTIVMGQSVASDIKNFAQRERPNGRNDESFPSKHVTLASVQAQMANLNVEHMPLDEFSKKPLNIAFNSFAALTGWARVETGEHYPSDVLAGWAIGYFVSSLGRAFIDPDRQQMLIRPKSGSGASGIELVIRF